MKFPVGTNNFSDDKTYALSRSSYKQFHAVVVNVFYSDPQISKLNYEVQVNILIAF